MLLEQGPLVLPQASGVRVALHDEGHRVSAGQGDFLHQSGHDHFTGLQLAVMHRRRDLVHLVGCGQVAGPQLDPECAARCGLNVQAAMPTIKTCLRFMRGAPRWPLVTPQIRNHLLQLSSSQI